MAEVPELDAVLGGGAWDVADSYDGDAAPAAPARLRGNVCYVVLAVLHNERDEVLLVQEAKAECRGKWYLPAGRMEPGEGIAAAVRREVREETGLECEPLTLLALEERGAAWMRFVFLARPTGGTLKTLQAADAESLQAAWWPQDVSALPLRAPDMLPLLALAARYRRSPSHPATLPQELPCAHVCLRLLVACAGPDGELWVLLSAAGAPRLPVTACSPGERGGLRAPALRLLREALPAPAPSPALLGLLGLQHRAGGPRGADGLCLTLLLAVAPAGGCSPPALRGPRLAWHRLREQGLRGRVLQRLRDADVVPVYS
ncbi:8-oxo-dGDP phosphatase NUDT18 [Eudromia elegans]